MLQTHEFREQGRQKKQKAGYLAGLPIHRRMRLRLVWISAGSEASHAGRSVTTLDKVPNDRDHCDYEKDVNQAANHREHKEAQRPKNDQDDRYREKHDCSLKVVSFANNLDSQLRGLRFHNEYVARARPLNGTTESRDKPEKDFAGELIRSGLG
jgi:hypothetical protein